MSPSDFFQNQLFRNIVSGIPSECLKVWIRIRPDVLSCQIWVQNVCNGCQQMTSKQRVNDSGRPSQSYLRMWQYRFNVIDVVSTLIVLTSFLNPCIFYIYEFAVCNRWKELCSPVGVKKSLTTPFHPMGNGVIKRFNQTLLLE